MMPSGVLVYPHDFVVYIVTDYLRQNLFNKRHDNAYTA